MVKLLHQRELFCRVMEIGARFRGLGRRGDALPISSAQVGTLAPEAEATRMYCSRND